MTTVIGGPRPPEVEAWLARRQAQGHDGRDECWGGRYYVAPQGTTAHGIIASEVNAELRGRARARGLVAIAEFNLGTGLKDYVVPDGGVVTGETGLYAATALVVLEVLSPDDATFDKFTHYAAHGVSEVLVADPATRRVRAWQLTDGAYVEGDTCRILELSMTDLTSAVAWP